jgi:hypothetical protein
MKIRRINLRKKGEWTMSELLSVIIAVVGLALIAFGVFKLYQLTVDSEEKNARETLDRIIGKVEALDSGEESELILQGFESKKTWYIVGWGKNDAGRPDKCFFESCICVCHSPSTFGDFKMTCQDSGMCEDVKIERVVVNTEYRQKWITIPDNLLKIKVIKQQEKLILTVGEDRSGEEFRLPRGALPGAG